jgi:DNA-binding SARP family transcriptional activator
VPSSGYSGFRASLRHSHWAGPHSPRTLPEVVNADLRLRLVGRFDVEGHVGAPVPGGRAARLLKVLAVHQGQFVPIDKLIDILWGGDAPERPDRNVAALVSRLRRCLGTERIKGGRNGYSLIRDRSTVVDVLDAEQLVSTAEHEMSSGQCAYAAVAAEQAVRILTAGRPLADEPDASWVDETRRHVRRLLGWARAVQWSAALELHDFRAAIIAAEDALKADALDEAACRALIQAYKANGEQAAALRVYEELREALVEELGANPSAETQALFMTLLRGQALGAGPAKRSVRGPSPERRLVGRKRELEDLQSLWSDSVQGRGGIAAVLGEAGIGKTAVVSELTAEVRRTGGLVVATCCFEAERSLYLQPLVEALGSVVDKFDRAAVREFAGDWLGTLTQLAPQIARTMGPVNYARANAEIEHRRNLEALTSFFSKVSERRSVLLLVEDIQNAGQSTVEALHFLASRLTERRILVVVTERVGQPTPVTSSLADLATVTHLDRLSKQDVVELIADAGLSYEVEEFFNLSGGLPLFITELIRHGKQLSVSGHAPLDIPDSLHETVSARLASVGDEVKTLLQQAAVLGGSFSLDDVAALSGTDVEECARAAYRALQVGLLLEQRDVFQFSNDIIRKTAYDSVPRPIRVSRHRRAAKLLEGQPEAAAHQLVAAEDWAPAAHSWQRAAENAHLDFANSDAERLLGNALSCAERAGDSRLMGEIHLRRAQIRDDLGHLSEAKDDCDAVVALARDLGDENLEAHALEQLGWTALYARDAFGATDLAERASHLAESAAAAPAARPSSLLLLGRVRHWDGDYAGATTAYGSALESAADDSTTAMVLAYRGALLQHMDHFAEARAVLGRAVVLSQRAGEFRLLLQALFFTGLARGDLGDFDGALRALGRALRMIDEYGVNYYRAGIHTTISWLWREIGDLGRARDHAEQAIDLAHRGGGALELEQELHALLALADCALAMGADDRAGALVERAVPLLDRSLPFRPRARMRLLEMQARWDRSQAEALLDEARTHSSKKYEALAWSHLGRPADAARIAGETGSDLIIAALGAPGDRRAALDRVAGALPGELRSVFMSNGRLVLPAE